ncbi:MAG: aminoglycoside phosphotransferase family protein [Gammaproteobacteria bacterium]|nr:aminoglycoside phosphotransferase family protein [Gammaproteobacteria bacterium]
MKILSLAEDESIAREADELCRIAEDCKPRLEELKSGSKITLAGKAFSCISSDKNFIYRVEGENSWYLKFSLQEEWIRHEIAGAEAVRATLGDYEGYQHAKAVRASLTERYTLYSAVEGKSFNGSLLYGCFSGLAKTGSTSMPAMENLGRCLGRFHGYKDPEGLTVLSPDTLSYLRTYLSNIKEPDLPVEKIANWVNEQDDTCRVTAWVHGNVKSEDILIADGKTCLIDFGTCGAGVPYEDLTDLCTYMMLFRAVPLFPWRIARHAMSVFLRGYAAEAVLSKDDLYNYITRGICRYYIKNVVLHNGIASISGMPVLKSRMEHLIMQLLQEDHEAAFDGVRF